MEIKRDTVPKEVSKEKLSNSYFLSGENEYKIKEFISVLKKKVLSPGFESFDLEKFDAIESEFDINDVIRAIMTPPMASLKRLVILDKVEKLKEPVRDMLLSVLESPNSSSILVIIASPSTKVKTAFWRKLKDKINCKSFSKLKGNSLENWITDCFKKIDYSIEQDAVHAIIEFSGDNQISLVSEIEKIITYVGEKRTLTRDDVLQVLTSNMVKNVFDLNDAIGGREREKAISTLDYLLEWGVVPDVIFGVLRYFFLRLRRMVYYKRKSLSNYAIARKLGVGDFAVKKEVGYFSEDEIKEKLNLLYRAEVRMKTGWDVNLVLTDLVYNLI